MIISIDYELFQKVKQIVKGRNLSIYEQLENCVGLIFRQFQSWIIGRLRYSVGNALCGEYDECIRCKW